MIRLNKEEIKNRILARPKFELSMDYIKTIVKKDEEIDIVDLLEVIRELIKNKFFKKVVDLEKETFWRIRNVELEQNQ